MQDDLKDKIILQDKHAHFRGTAKVKLKHLQFNNFISLFDSSNVSRLVKVFKLDGCARLDPDHHVPAVIDESELKSALNRSHVSEADLLKPLQTEPPELLLPNDFILTYLHGQHRIAAAREFLLPGDQWWIVDLYVSGISEDTTRHIREEYSNSRKFSDGEIYRHVRFYQQSGDISTERKWLARLSDNKQKAMKQLQKNSWLTGALDNLLSYSGLWPALQLGSIPAILSWKCQKEICSYLGSVNQTWNTITCNGDGSIVPFVDESTVELLQSLSPSSCSGDRSLIQTLIETRKVFPKLRDSALRSRVLGQLLSQNGTVLSLHTFFEDTKYLEPVVMVLRGLLPSNFEEPIQDAIKRRYTGVSQQDGQYYLEYGEGDIRTFPGSEAEGIYYGYRQLCLYAMRHFRQMTKISPRMGKKPRGAKPPGKSNRRLRSNNQSLWHKLAELAYKLGFDSEEIQQLLRENPDEDMIRSSLHLHRPEEDYEIDHNDFEAEVQRQCEALNKFKKRQLDPLTPKLSVDFGGVPISERCGRPDDDSYDFDKKYLFLPTLYGATKDSSPKSGITSFAVKRIIFQAFFGYVRPSGKQQVQNNTESTVLSKQHGNPSLMDGGSAVMDIAMVEEPNATVRPEPLPEPPPVQRPEPLSALRLPASTRTVPDRDAARLHIHPRRPPMFDGVLDSIRSVSRICMEGNGIAFFRVQSKEHTIVDNNEQAVQQMALEITEGHFRKMKLNKPQKFGYVKDGWMAAINLENIYKLANREEMDYPRVVILVDGSKESPEANAFGMAFETFCSKVSSGGSTQRLKRTGTEADVPPKQYRQR